MKNKKIILITIILSLILYPLLTVRGFVSFYEENADFNPNNIISDNILTDFNSLNIEQIRDFLIIKGGALANYTDPELKLPAYYIIWQASQEFNINPKFLLTMLQKEQSLVTDLNPSQSQFDWATGYSCYGGICLDDYRGFGRQVRATANKFINSYLADLNVLGKHKKGYYCTFTKWCVGDAHETQDEQIIYPENRATCALYTYNPYRGGTISDGLKIGANYNFWKIWNSWFDASIFRPDGTLLKTKNEDTVYLIKNGQKRPFKNFTSLITRFDPENIIMVEPAELEKFPLGPEIKFAQYSLLENENKEIFLVDGDSLRKIAGPDVFKILGFNPEEVETVSNADLSGATYGKIIDIYDSYPTGALIRDIESGGIYYVRGGIKYPIFSKEILLVNYPNYAIDNRHPDELAKYPKGEAVKFKDGTLIKSKDGSKVYFIALGKKLPIADEQAFISRGYSWNKVIETSQAAVDIHPTGQILEAIDTSVFKSSSSPAAPTTTLESIESSTTTLP